MTYRGVNAQIESLIGLYKSEWIDHRGPWPDLDHVEIATLEWVHWFNKHRPHSAIGYVPPTEYEQTYYRQITSPQQPLSGELASH